MRAKFFKKMLKKNLTRPIQSVRVAPHTENPIRNMRTKSLILTAALGLAGIASSLAQPVYSVNAVGYINRDVPSGFSMIANQLNTTNNTIANLLTTLPNNSNFYKWTGTDFDIATFFFGSWDKPNLTLNPGEGGFVNVASPATITFVGDVPEGNLSNPIPVGFSIRSSQVPQAGPVDTLGLTLNNNDNLYKWNGSSYDIYTFFFGSWSPSTPTLAVGESIFINAGTATSWNRTFAVSP